MCTYPQTSPDGFLLKQPLLLLRKDLGEAVGEKLSIPNKHVIIRLLASVDDCSMCERCVFALTIVDYIPRPKSTTIAQSERYNFSSLRGGRPESGLGWYH